MNRLICLTLTLLITSHAIAERPNILFIFTDDPAYEAIRDQMTRRLHEQRKLYRVGFAYM